MAELVLWAGFTGETDGQPNGAIAMAIAYKATGFHVRYRNGEKAGLWAVVAGPGGAHSAAELLDPEIAAKETLAIWEHGGSGAAGWSQWAIYREGAHGSGYETSGAYATALKTLQALEAKRSSAPPQAVGVSGSVSAKGMPRTSSPGGAGLFDWSGTVRALAATHAQQAATASQGAQALTRVVASKANYPSLAHG